MERRLAAWQTALRNENRGGENVPRSARPAPNVFGTQIAQAVADFANAASESERDLWADSPTLHAALEAAMRAMVRVEGHERQSAACRRMGVLAAHHIAGRDGKGVSPEEACTERMLWLTGVFCDATDGFLNGQCP